MIPGTDLVSLTVLTASIRTYKDGKRIWSMLCEYKFPALLS